MKLNTWLVQQFRDAWKLRHHPLVKAETRTALRRLIRQLRNIPPEERQVQPSTEQWCIQEKRRRAYRAKGHNPNDIAYIPPLSAEDQQIGRMRTAPDGTLMMTVKVIPCNGDPARLETVPYAEVVKACRAATGKDPDLGSHLGGNSA